MISYIILILLFFFFLIYKIYKNFNKYYKIKFDNPSDINKFIFDNINNINISNTIIDNYDNTFLKKEILFRYLNNIIDKDVKTSLKTIKYFDYKDDMSFISLKIKILCKNNKLDESLKIYENLKIKKKRFIIPIYEEYCLKSKKIGLEFLEKYIYNKFTIDENDICKIYGNKNLDKILKIMSDNEIIINDKKYFIKYFNCKECKIFNNKCSICNNELELFKLNDYNISKLLSNLEKQYFFNKKNILKNLDNFLSNNIYDVVIDGNNILLHCGIIDENSISRLFLINNILKVKNLKSLIFIHSRHKETLDNFNINKYKFNIYYTPCKFYDDIFFIWTALKYNKYIISNDLFKDIIYKLQDDNFSKFINYSLITYKFFNNKYILNFPLNYSFKTQKNSNKWHIPTYDNNWFCL